MERKIAQRLNPLAGWLPMLRKELIHMRRDSAAFLFAIGVPIMQLLLVGAAVRTNIRDIATVVYDAAQTQESHRLLERFVNSGDFKLIRFAQSDEEMNQEIVAGRARVGIKIPPDYSRRALAGETARVLVLVDGSDARVAGEAAAAADAIALLESLESALGAAGQQQPLVEVRRRMLFNPDSRSQNFLLPGMIAILLHGLTALLTALAIVREREQGTLDQLYMTPIKGLGLMTGKIVPYLVVSDAELFLVLALMCWVFDVPIHGSLPLLLLFTIPYLLAMLGLGLLISARVHTQAQAMQVFYATVLPTFFLSGYIFPVESMPEVFQWCSKLLPATYLIEILRGIILRGAGLAELWGQGLALIVISFLLLSTSALSFRKKAF